MSGVKRYTAYDALMQVESNGKFVLASDYDRDTQRLSDESHRNRVDLVDAVERSDRIKAERDELRAQVEVMMALLCECRDFTDTLQWPQRLRGKIDAAIQDNKP